MRALKSIGTKSAKDHTRFARARRRQRGLIRGRRTRPGGENTGSVRVSFLSIAKFLALLGWKE